MRISIINPSGVAPSIDARLLGDSQAQKAINTRFLRSWQGWGAPVKVANFKRSPPINSIFLGGNNDILDWWEWQTAVNVVWAPRYGDNSVIYSGDGAPKITDATLSAGAGALPNASYDLGLVYPTIAPTVSVSGTAIATEADLDVFVVYTFVDAKGKESRPSPPSTMITAKGSQTINVSAMTTPSGANSYVGKRIYATAGASTTGFYLRGEVPAGTPTFAFTALAADTGAGPQDALITQTFFAPPTDTKSLVYMPGEFLAGISGDELVFSESSYLYAFDPNKRIKVYEKPVSLQVFGNTLVVGTEGRPYFYQGLEPESLQETKGEGPYACVSARSMVDCDGSGVAYASTEGFIFQGQGGARMLTPGFLLADWQALNPASMHAVYWSGYVIAFYDAGGSNKGALVIPLAPNEDPHFWSTWASAAYVERKTNALYLALTDGIYRWNFGAPQSWTWESKIYALPKKTSFAAMQVRSTGPVTVIGKADGRVQWTRTANNDVVTVGGGYLGSEWTFEFQSSYKMTSFDIATSFSELVDV
jgi:hypothetical protein